MKIGSTYVNIKPADHILITFRIISAEDSLECGSVLYLPLLRIIDVVYKHF